MTGWVTRREAVGLTVGLSATALLAWWRPGDDQGATPGEVTGDPDRSAPTVLGQQRGADDEDAESPTGAPAAAHPTRLVIEAIDLDEPVRALGLTEAGEIAPPPGVVQWYTGSVAPGQQGNSVIAGHVTSPQPDVFHRLAELVTGARVAVTDRSGTRRIFEVEAMERIDKQVLTTDPRVWGETHRRMLVLITCDQDTPAINGHHSGNVVVWASETT